MPSTDPIAPDDDLYAEWRCTRCGVCCGSRDGHPCEHLKPDGERYRCEIYRRRFGIHRTTTGEVFRCVSIRHLIETTGGHSECAYVQEALRRRGAGALTAGRMLGP